MDYNDNNKDNSLIERTHRTHHHHHHHFNFNCLKLINKISLSK